jgi:hypothetical protein
MLGEIDLIFGIWVYNDELQINFTFCSGPILYMSQPLSGGDIKKNISVLLKYISSVGLSPSIIIHPP